MVISPEDALKIVLAVVLGGLIGAEREYSAKTAGFRTIILICVGATLFTMLSARLAGPAETARIAAAVVSGVGFLGAGAILRGPERIVGLTTASTIWLAAALGMAIGTGEYLLASFAAIVGFTVLLFFPRIERRIDDLSDARTYKVVCRSSSKLFRELEDDIRACGLSVKQRKRVRSGDEMVCTWHIFGSIEGHDCLIDKLFTHPEVNRFHY
jgi:putative Mg2+ transporter-C (MgtC) family protein